MSILSSLVKRPVTVLIIFLVTIVFGVFIALRLKIELIPSVEFPTVVIIANYPNASPAEIEESITKPIESYIQGIKNIKDFTSTSSEGISQVIVNFEYGTSLSENVNNLRDRIAQVEGFLPSDAGKPVIYQFNPDSIPVATIAVSANRSSNEVRQFLEDVLKPIFEQVSGVASVQIQGGDTQKIFVDVDLYRLKEFGISMVDIENAVYAGGIRTSIGSIETPTQNIGLLLDDQYKSVKQIQSIVIAKTIENQNTENISYITIGDVADVYKGYSKNIDQYAFLEDKSVVFVDFLKESGQSIVKVSDNVIDAIASFKQAAPPDFDFVVIDDNSKLIRDNLRNIAFAILIGGALAIIVLLVFLRNFASVFVIAIAIPSAVIITLMAMYFLDLSLNILTLAGLAVGIGMLVDNSIVVLENIYIKRMSGVRLLAASEFGATEMMRPILASTLTSVMVFLPMVLFKKELGVPGAFFSNLGIVIVIALLSSFLVASFVVPIMTSKYIPINPIHHKGIFKKFDIIFDASISFVRGKYIKALSYMIKKPKRFIALILACSIVPIFFLAQGIGFELYPKFKEEGVIVSLEFPKETKPDVMMPIMREVHESVKKEMPDIDFYILSVNGDASDSSSSFLDFNTYFASNGSGQLSYIFKTPESVDIIEKLDVLLVPLLSKYIGVVPRVQSLSRGGPPSRGGGVGGASFISLKVKADDYKTLTNTLDLFKNTLETATIFSNVEIDKSISSMRYVVTVDAAKAALHNIDVRTISRELKNALADGGKIIGKFTDGAKERDIYLQLKNKDKESLDVINQIKIRKGREFIPLSNFITLEPDLEPLSIRRENGKRTENIYADIRKGYATNQAVQVAKNILGQIPKPDGVSYEFAGEYKEQQENLQLMLSIIFIAVLFVFSIMASQFESFRDPFIIIFTVPLTIIGVFIIYRIIQLPITSFTLIGIVVLMGVAVNHGIVMVDYMNLLRNREVPFKKAVVEGAQSRLLPILMTTCTTVLGLLPTALFDFVGSEFIRPIAATIVGGLSTSAFLSLLLVPLLYYVFNRALIKRQEKKNTIKT